MRFIMFLSIFLSVIGSARADVVHLKNGDKLTGEIIYDSTTRLVIATEAAGEISIQRQFVKDYKTSEEVKKDSAARKKEKSKAFSGDVKWTRKVSVSYSQEGGNDKESKGSWEAFVNRKTADDEATAKVTGRVDTEDKSLDTKKFYGLLRYANSFGEDKKWFQFGKLEGSQDSTTSVDYRITPSYGAGYWFIDEDDFKVRVESAVGYEYTKYDDGSSSEGEVVLTPSAHLVKTFDNGISLTQDFRLYPSLEDISQYRFRSETAVTGRLTEQVNWKFSLVDDYDSEPRGTKKKNDWLLSTGLEYNF